MMHLCVGVLLLVFNLSRYECFKGPLLGQKQRGTIYDRSSIVQFAASNKLSESVAMPSSALAPKRDNVLEKGAIFLLSYLLCRLIPEDSALSSDGFKYIRPGMEFSGFCSVAKLLLRSSNPEIVKTKIVNLLLALMPLKVREFFRKTYKENSRLVCEQSSEWIGFGFLTWLIGPTERFNIGIDAVPKAKGGGLKEEAGEAGAGEKEQWRSGTKLLECRFLQESGCKSTCLNLCKGPTENLFNEQLGLPLRMTPNYEDCSCTFEFGLDPLPVDEDPVYATPCYLNCSLTKDKKDSFRCN
jgi:hypothetical protein